MFGVAAGGVGRWRRDGAAVWETETPLEARTAGDELVVTVDADEQPLFDWYWPRYDWPVMLAIDDPTS